IKLRKRLYTLPMQTGLITGVLRTHPRGFGFVSTRTGPEDIYIHRENISDAMHGDLVLVQLSNNPLSTKGIRTTSEGRILKVIERANDQIVGNLFKGEKAYYVVPDNPRLIQDVWVGENAIGNASSGDKVCVSILRWPNKHLNPEGEVIEILGRSDDPKVDLKAILATYNWSKSFPAGVENEVKKLKESISSDEFAKRKDLRHHQIFTIDPEDARDFDDAISIIRQDYGWLLGIHIADVSHYVQSGTRIDKEASERANTIYFIDETVRMLPEALTWDICSLRVDCDRLAKSLLVSLDQNGNVLDWELCKSIIRSKRRFSYDEVNQLLAEGGRKDPLYQDLTTLNELSVMLRKTRVASGALELDFPEAVFKLSPDGNVQSISLHESGVSHHMVEECMLLANRLIGELMMKSGYPSLYRIHEPPSPSDQSELKAKLYKMGVQERSGSLIKYIQNTIHFLRKSPKSFAIQLAILKSLKQARYSVTHKEHFALAMPVYLHFTSPIRRYSDLVVHQILDCFYFKLKSTGSHFDALQLVAEHCSDKERISEDAERYYEKIKRLRFLQQKWDHNKRFTLDAYIIDVKEFGFFVQDERYLFEGLVHISDLNKDFFVFDENHLCLVGRKTRVKYRIGDRVKVVIQRIDMMKKEIRFRLAL
ncbi:MAG: ribonuclease R, partial [Chlamydiota bacterium]|nr:ribonuclease R [Chlamydiota bacterium]